MDGKTISSLILQNTSCNEVFLCVRKRIHVPLSNSRNVHRRTFLVIITFQAVGLTECFDSYTQLPTHNYLITICTLQNQSWGCPSIIKLHQESEKIKFGKG